MNSIEGKMGDTTQLTEVSDSAEHPVDAHGHHLTEDERKKMESFESLDYDWVDNELLRERSRTMTSRERRIDSIWDWGIYAAVGVCTALIAFVLSIFVEKLAESKFAATELLIGNETGYGGGYAAFVGFDILFVGIAAFLVCFIEPAAGGSGIPDMKGYLNGSNMPNLLNFKTLVVKVVGVAFAVAGGLTIGKEGPMVHTGGGLGANLSHLPKLPNFFGSKKLKRWRGDFFKRDFVSGGTAAGVAAAFGAPVGGVLFALEEASSFWSLPLTWRVFFCAIMSTFTLNICQASYNGTPWDVNSPGLITFGHFPSVPYRLWEIPIFLCLAVVGGLWGGLFCKLNNALCHWRRDRLAHRPMLRFLEAVLVAALSGTAFYVVPMLVSGCHELPAGALDAKGVLFEEYKRFGCPEGQYSQMAAKTFVTQEKAILSFFHTEIPIGSTVLVAYFFVYAALALLTYGIAVPSGMFVPCILIGCAYGRLVGEMLTNLFPDAGINAGVYALMGATSMLGGVARMTISLTVILLETTNDVQYVLPIMMVLTMSKWVGDCFTISLYDLHVELKCIPFVEAEPPQHLQQLCAKDVMRSPVVTLPPRPSVQQVVDTLKSCTHNGFPVVISSEEGDQAQGNTLLGIILRNQMVTLLEHRCFVPVGDVRSELEQQEKKDATEQQWGTVSSSADGSGEEKEKVLDLTDFSTSLQSHVLSVEKVEGNLAADDMRMVMNLRPYMNRAPFTVQESTSCARIYRLYRGMGIRHLPVVDLRNRVVGILSRKELRTDFTVDLN